MKNKFNIAFLMLLFYGCNNSGEVPYELTDIQKLNIIACNYDSELNSTNIYIRNSSRDSKLIFMAKNVNGESFGPVKIRTDQDCNVEMISERDVIKPFDVPREAIRKIIPDLCALKISVIRYDSLGNIFVGIMQVENYDYVFFAEPPLEDQNDRYEFMEDGWYKIK